MVENIHVTPPDAPGRVTRAVIPAAGRGLRAFPKTSCIAKALLEIDGKSLLERNIERLRCALAIRDITVIVGHLEDQIRQALGDGSRLDVSLRYVRCPNPDAGLAQGLLLVEKDQPDPFVVTLADEFYIDSNHAELLSAWRGDCDVVCGILPTLDLHQIKRNYAVTIEDGRIHSLEEKPLKVENDLLGCGTYIFGPALFQAIRETSPSVRSGRIELTDAIDRLARAGRVRPFYLRGGYHNINTVDDYNETQYRVREARFGEKKISVIIPAYNEEDSVGYVVRDFREAADEVLVVDNSSRDRTAEVARNAGARVESVQLHGYGDTIRWGLEHASGDILVVVEADFSFRSRDLRKMLEYLKDADMVVGTRTTREMVEQGANMRGPVRWGNVIVAKLVELLWWNLQPRFTDVGCTYRALWKQTYQALAPLLSGMGPELSPEMMIACLLARKRIIEVPVSYHRRIGGESKHSANYLRISRTAFRMLRTIARQRLSRR